MAAPDQKPVDLKSSLRDRLSSNEHVAIDEDDRQTDYIDHGTVEGRIEVIHKESDSLEFRVSDLLFPHAIRCAVPEELMDRALHSIGHRVEIEGKIRYRCDGVPMSIEAQAIEVLPTDNELPTAADMRGIMAV